jgi:hypothetical protein
MMNVMQQVTEQRTIPREIRQTLDHLEQCLAGRGLQVVRSFDLQMACLPQNGCKCLYHGTADCDCQLAVLQVYDQNGRPLTLLVHGFEGQTHLSFIEDPDDEQQRQVHEKLLTCCQWAG